MSGALIRIGGETFLALETVAEIYRVDAVWLREVCDAGFLDDGFVAQPTLCIAAARLDRVASIVRLRRMLGADLETIRLALGA